MRVPHKRFGQLSISSHPDDDRLVDVVLTRLPDAPTMLRRLTRENLEDLQVLVDHALQHLTDKLRAPANFRELAECAIGRAERLHMEIYSLVPGQRSPTVILRVDSHLWHAIAQHADERIRQNIHRQWIVVNHHVEIERRR